MKKYLSLSAILIVIALLTGCSSNNGEKVYVYNWGEYIDPNNRAF